MATTPTPEVAPKPPKTDGEKPVKGKKEKPPKPEKPVKPPKVKAEKSPKVKKERPPKVPREKKPLDKKKLLIIAIAILLLLLVGVGIFIVKMLGGKSDDDKTEITSSDIVSNETIDEGTSSADADASSNSPPAEDTSSPDADSSTGDTASEDGRDAIEGDGTDVSTPADETSSAEMVGGAGGVSPEQKEEKPFEFDERSLTLPAYSYRTSIALERAVHNDLQALLDSKDDRPGVGIASVVIADSYVMENGTLRVLAYVWGNRYAIAENTLFDYGSMAGPVALDYAGAGVYALDEIHLPRAGDAYEQSVKDMCGTKEETAKRMIRKGYDLELRGQMIRNVSSYITQNNVGVEYFRSGAQTYHKNGEIYIPKNKSAEPTSTRKNEPSSLTASSEAPDASEASEVSGAPATQDAQPTDEKQLEEDYKNYQKLPL